MQKTGVLPHFFALVRKGWKGKVQYICEKTGHSRFYRRLLFFNIFLWIIEWSQGRKATGTNGRGPSGTRKEHDDAPHLEQNLLEASRVSVCEGKSRHCVLPNATGHGPHTLRCQRRCTRLQRVTVLLKLSGELPKMNKKKTNWNFHIASSSFFEVFKASSMRNHSIYLFRLLIEKAFPNIIRKLYKY